MYNYAYFFPALDPVSGENKVVWSGESKETLRTRRAENWSDLHKKELEYFLASSRAGDFIEIDGGMVLCQRDDQ